MIGSKQREPINPLMGAMKSGHPTWNTAEECRHNWRLAKWKNSKRKGKKPWKEKQRVRKPINYEEHCNGPNSN